MKEIKIEKFKAFVRLICIYITSHHNVSTAYIIILWSTTGVS